MEAKVWNSQDAAAGIGEHHHLDMRVPYLACEDSRMGRVGDAIDLVQEYGFPTSVMRQAYVENVPLNDFLMLTGAIQLSAWVFGPKTHPYTIGRVGEHLSEYEGWIITLELKDLLESGEATAREVVYGVGSKASIKFLVDKDLAMRFIGKCARHGDEFTILVRNSNEAAFLCKTLGGMD